jgi:hypothetical protein
MGRDRGTGPYKNEVRNVLRRCRARGSRIKKAAKEFYQMIKNYASLMVTFAMLAFCPLGRAQDHEPTIDSTIAVVRANMQADRTTLITAGMNFNDKDGAAFWPIYKQYEYERSRLDDDRVVVIKEYTQKYPKLTDAQA